MIRLKQSFFAQVDHWLDFSNFRLASTSDFASALQQLDASLKMCTYLVGDAVTIADYAVWSFLKGTASLIRELIN